MIYIAHELVLCMRMLSEPTIHILDLQAGILFRLEVTDQINHMPNR